MAEDSVAEVRQRLAEGVDAFNRGDLDAAAEGLAPECRYQVAREHPESRLWVGPEAIKRYQRAWFDQFEDVSYQVADVLVGLPYALVLGRITGRGVGSGLELDVDLAFLYELDDELMVTTVVEILDADEARREFKSLTAG